MELLANWFIALSSSKVQYAKKKKKKNAKSLPAASAHHIYLNIGTLYHTCPKISMSIVISVDVSKTAGWMANSTDPDQMSHSVTLFVLRFYSPVNPMGSCREQSVYLTTLLLGRLSPLSSFVHILSPETEDCPSWISGRERMTIESISWSISTKKCCRPDILWHLIWV